MEKYAPSFSGKFDYKMKRQNLKIIGIKKQDTLPNT